MWLTLLHNCLKYDDVSDFYQTKESIRALSDISVKKYFPHERIGSVKKICWVFNLLYLTFKYFVIKQIFVISDIFFRRSSVCSKEKYKQEGSYYSESNNEKPKQIHSFRHKSRLSSG